jgi:hypothetical protein
MDSANAYIYGAGNTPSEQVNLSTGAITYLVADSLGSVRGALNSSGSLTGTTSYTPGAGRRRMEDASGMP